MPDATPECLNPNCNACVLRAKEAEAEQGLRCKGCLDSFDKQYPFQSEEDPTLCIACLRVAKAPKFPAPVTYGTAAVRRGTT